MRILFITQWFQPEATFKGLPFAKELVKKGHHVQVLTGFPNYPTGKLFPGYKMKFFQREQMDGVDVVRVPLYPSHDSSALGRIVNYLSFALSAAVLGPWLTKKPDIIYAFHPPPTTYLPAFVLKLLYRVPVVYDIQDFWPETLAATGMFNNRWGLKLVDLYCRLFYKAADKIVVLSPGFKKKLIEKGVPEDSVEIIYNWFDEKNLEVQTDDADLPDVLTQKDTFKILFAGNMGKAQALETVLKAAAILKDSNPPIKFVFIGGGVEVEHLKQQSVQMHLPNVCFLPPVPHSEIAAYLNASDVLLVHLKRDPLFEITVPSKIQAYLAAGKPILCAVPGDASDLVKQAGAGLECPSEDADALAKVALDLAQMPIETLSRMGRQGKEYYTKCLSLKAGVNHFEQLFGEVIKAH
ncbi:MAG: glycosyltransferase family 4 protein [Planctomycetales bacterium]|nr:glycosyltransferase family 4 protein [Planctomycetales bacterium]